MPYSPLGKGFLTGAITSIQDVTPGDFRSIQPRFQAEALNHNLALVEILKRLAAARDATPAQIALAWLLAKAPWIVPIPGTTKIHRMQENNQAAEITLSTDDLALIEAELATVTIEGARYTPAIEATTGL